MALSIGLDGDIAGGAVTATSTKLIEGKKPIRIGDPVANHGAAPHDAAVMVGGSATVIIEGKGVCRQGDAASCGHTLVASATQTFAG